MSNTVSVLRLPSFIFTDISCSFNSCHPPPPPNPNPAHQKRTKKQENKRVRSASCRYTARLVLGHCLTGAILTHPFTQIDSHQVKSECLTCTFRASCCSARLSRAQVPAGSSVRDRKTKRGGEGRKDERNCAHVRRALNQFALNVYAKQTAVSCPKQKATIVKMKRRMI